MPSNIVKQTGHACCVLATCGAVSGGSWNLKAGSFAAPGPAATRRLDVLQSLQLAVMQQNKPPARWDAAQQSAPSGIIFT